MKKIIAFALSMMMVMGSGLTPMSHAASLPQLSSTNADNDYTTVPTYNPEWGLNLPSEINPHTSYGQFQDHVVLDLVRTNNPTRFVRRQVALSFLEAIYSYGSGIPITDGKVRLSMYGPYKQYSVEKVYKDVVAANIAGILDKNGKEVPLRKDLNGMDQLFIMGGPIELALDTVSRVLLPFDDNYYEGIEPGQTVMSIEFYKDSPIASNFKLRSDWSWEKVRSAVAYTNIEASINQSFNSGVSETDASSFAKTIGSSIGINLGAQLKAGKSSETYNGTLSANFSYTMSKSITQSFSHSRQVSMGTTTNVNFKYPNTKDYSVAVGVYHPNEKFTVELKGDQEVTAAQRNAYNQFKRFADEKGTVKLVPTPSYTYSYPDYISITSEKYDLDNK